MQLALDEAQKALEAHEVPVGCIITQNSCVVARGHNLTNTTANPLEHAELVALKKITKVPAEDLVFYITCEPCIMCMGVLNRINAKVYYGCHNPTFGGLTVAGIGGNIACIQNDACVSILKKFYARENVYAPEDRRKSKLQNKS